MKRENQAAVTAVRDGKVGDVCFIRYSLHAPNKPYETIGLHIKEAFDWVSEVNGKKELKDLYATANPEKTVWLVTCQFAGGAMANLFFDFSGHTHVKQMEVAGTDGLYVFDSSVEQAFQSDFLKTHGIEPESESGVQADEWWILAEESLRTRDKVEPKGGCRV